MYDHTFHKQVQISRSDIRPHIKWAVSLVILHFVNLLPRFVWVYMGYHTHFITPEGMSGKEGEGERVLLDFYSRGLHHKGLRDLLLLDVVLCFVLFLFYKNYH